MVTTIRKVPATAPDQHQAKTKVASVISSAEGGHIMLDNDVMVDYDVPMLNSSPSRITPPHDKSRNTSQQQNKIQKSASKRHSSQEDDANNEMARVLRANPNISMRELFPGEEEMGLHAYIPLKHGKKMPDGWSKVTTVLQYDEVTKQMFEELQRPYGNQSSFLRHLVLLEKYFRNGELLLSHNASSSAQIYSESVQTRLRSYDNIATGGLRIMQQQSPPSNIIPPVSITPAVTIKPKPKAGTSDTPITSLLKHNLPPTQQSTPVSSQQQVIKHRQISITNESKPQDILEAASKLMQAEEKAAAAVAAAKKTNLPPEILNITKSANSEIAISAIPSNNRKSPVPSTSTVPPPAPPPNSSQKQSPNIIKLPDTLSPQERRQTNGKPWRPTLIPIVPGALTNPPNGPLYQTVDGRKLPSLVQVMSGGKPYHISIHDYNRMCILRREKLLMQNQANMRQKKMAESIAKMQQQQQAIDNMRKLQIPNQILEQNSLIPVTNNSKNDTSNNGSNSKRKSAPNSLLKSNLNAKLTANQNIFATMNSSMNNYPTTITATTTSSSMMMTPQQSFQSTKLPTLSNPHLTITATPSQSQTQSQQQQLLPSSIEMIKWNAGQNNFAENLLNNINGHNNGSGISNMSLGGNTSGGALILDNSAVSVLSKIPKSLTIIPQQKERQRVPSSEEQIN